MPDLVNLCPVWGQPCLREKCISYSVHTKHRFKNIKTNSYIPLDQLEFYKNISDEQIEETVERHATIVRECRRLGKIIEIENVTDHLIPGSED